MEPSVLKYFLIGLKNTKLSFWIHQNEFKIVLKLFKTYISKKNTQFRKCIKPNKKLIIVQWKVKKKLVFIKFAYKLVHNSFIIFNKTKKTLCMMNDYYQNPGYLLNPPMMDVSDEL